MIEPIPFAGNVDIGEDGTVPYIIASSPPKPVGYWVLYPPSTWQKVNFAMYHKPTAEQIKNTEELLGWGWVDEL